MKQYLEAGRLGAPRGIKGELRFECWCDSPEFLENIQKLYLDENGERFLEIDTYRVNIPSIIFKNYQDRTKASSLTNRTVYFDRNEITLPEGVCYNDDLIGLDVFISESSEKIGILTAIEEGVRYELYVVTSEKTYRIPNIPQYVLDRNLEKGIFIANPEGLEA